MKRPGPVQLFEHDKLTIDQSGSIFKQRHLDLLEKYHEATGGKYFSLIRNGIRFCNYVGVIQAGELTIEILPKPDRNSKDKTLWRAVLLDMLRECHWMQIDTHENAQLQLRNNAILDAYFDIFLTACETLLHQGLVRKYRRQEGNCTALKGRLVFSQHIRRNTVHQEQFYVSHTVYDSNNLYNRILLKAIKLVMHLAPVSLTDKAGRVLFDWPELPDIGVHEDLFSRIKYDRKTERYREAMEIACMLLLNYRPDLSHGTQDVLAILFDMNELWEEFIYRRLKKALLHAYGNGHISRQSRRNFWQTDNFYKTVRPDIVIHLNGLTTILDTKWKNYDNLRLIDDELKQMYVYSHLWNADRTFLVTPFHDPGVVLRQSGCYHELQGDTTILGRNSCSWLGVNVVKAKSETKGKLCPDIGEYLLQQISL